MNSLILQNVSLEELKNIISETVKIAVSNINLDKPPQEDVELLTRTEAAKLLKCSLPTLDKFVRDGYLPFKRFGTAKRFKKSDLLHVPKSKK